MRHADGSAPQSHPILAEAFVQRPMIASLGARAARHLADEIGLVVDDVQQTDAAPGPVTLEHLTAVIGIGGPSGVLVAFSFSEALTEALLRNLGATLALPDDEAEAFREAGLAEAANVIAGNWIADLAAPDARNAMMPPMVIEGARPIHHVPDATFCTISITTDAGPLRVHLIGPQDLFDFYRDAA